jgi:hypothetical protein
MDLVAALAGGAAGLFQRGRRAQQVHAIEAALVEEMVEGPSTTGSHDFEF